MPSARLRPQSYFFCNSFAAKYFVMAEFSSDLVNRQGLVNAADVASAEDQ